MTLEYNPPPPQTERHKKAPAVPKRRSPPSWSRSDKQLSIKECFEILELYSDWNTSQKSVQLAFGGVRTDEDDVLDARRALLTKVYKRLENLV